jgi:hypothetical protein
MATTDQLDRWFDKGVDDGYTHMIIACDEMDEADEDHGSYPIYVNDHYEDLNAMVSTAMLTPLQHVHEVYALWLNKRVQLRGRNVWNVQSSPHPRSITILTCGCEIPWKAGHRKNTELYQCHQHGLVAVHDIK